MGGFVSRKEGKGGGKEIGVVVVLSSVPVG